MLTLTRTTRSAVVFDIGAAGVRACQLRGNPSRPRIADTLDVELPRPEEAPEPAGAQLDASQLALFVEQARFTGRDVALLVSPPDVRFHPLHLPAAALEQPPERVAQALKWEVAQDSRMSAEQLEVRHWRLPPARGQHANVMAVSLAADLALKWCEDLAAEGLELRRIETTPGALVRAALALFQPEPHDLWGILDLGLRHSTLTAVVGRVPVYVRTLAASADRWTRQVAEVCQVTVPVAERLKRDHGVRRSERGTRSTDGAAAGRGAIWASDIGSVLGSVLRPPLIALSQEVGRCLSYVMQSYPDVGSPRVFLAGGGADLGGLDDMLRHELGIEVQRFTEAAAPLAGGLTSRAAAAYGGALLDLEARP